MLEHAGLGKQAHTTMKHLRAEVSTHTEKLTAQVDCVLVHRLYKHTYVHKVILYRMDRNFRGTKLSRFSRPSAKSIIRENQHCLLSCGVKMAGGTRIAQYRVRAPLLH